jgi:hypothetical protein
MSGRRQAKAAKRARRSEEDGKPVSLAPLQFEQALEALLKVDPKGEPTEEAEEK